jgi:neutral ceramidase
MKLLSRSTRLLAAALLTALLFWSLSPACAADLRAGAAAVKITPPNGTPMAGYYSLRLSEGVHDDLYAKALVLEVGGEKAAFVTLDLISTTREIVETARREIEKTTGVKGRNVMISATHAHTGPLLSSGSVRDGALAGATDVVRQYCADLSLKIAQSVREAEARLAPAALSTALVQEESISFNRRFHMKDGTVGWNPGKLNPNIVKPAGPIDPDVAVLYLETAEKKPLATYVNYANHLDTVGGAQISADYPYTLAKVLGEIKSPEMVTLFANGCCGNINHIDVNWPERQQGHAEAARIGTILAASVLRSYSRLKPVTVGPLQVRTEMVKLPLPAVTPDGVAKAREASARFGTKEQPPFLETVNAFKVLDVAAREGKPLDVEVQVVTLGDEVAWVSLPGEIFVEIGLAIKKASPFKHTLIAELANGSIGYIPDRKAYAEGNYEVVSARCAEGSGELLVEAALRLLRQAKAEKAR